MAHENHPSPKLVHDDASMYVQRIIGLSDDSIRTYLSASPFVQKIVLRRLALRSFLRREISFFTLLFVFLPRSLRSDAVQHLIQTSPSLNIAKLNTALNQRERDKAMVFNEIVTRDQYKARELIRDYVVLDIGANIGTFSFFVHYLAPQAKIFAFEPTQEIFTQLQKTIDTHNLSHHIVPMQVAMGEREEVGTLMIEEESLGVRNLLSTSAFLKGREDEFSNSHPISITTIDAFVQQENLPRVDFIKIDTEGYEKEIIRGAKHVLRTHAPILTCSAYHLGEDKKDIPALMQSINPSYQYELSDDMVFIFRVPSK